MKKTFIIYAALAASTVLLGEEKVCAQSIGPATLNAAGGGTVIAGNSYDFSIGEMTVVSTNQAGSIVVTQGVLQPYDHPMAVHDVPLANNLKVYPNPATNVVNIQYNAQAAGKVSYSLLDMTGKVITAKSAAAAQGTMTEQVNVSALPAATYMLQVTVDIPGTQKQTIPYKIQKLQ
jgi:hypothetical protein